jgi:hypothetical protein
MDAISSGVSSVGSMLTGGTWSGGGSATASAGGPAEGSPEWVRQTRGERDANRGISCPGLV